ncbi:MAG: hypothetical protein FJW35_17205 [Acidobacteria bacterium]|nr:hypothetical protein [Acidobacteriota bacterium]
MAMTPLEILDRRLQRAAAESNYVNTLNVHGRVTIEFVWWPGAGAVIDSLVDPFVVDHPTSGARREITYTWTPQGGRAITRVMNSGRITIPLPLGGRGTLTAFGTTWQISRAANGVNMSPVNQMRGVQQRLNRLGYHLRRPGAQSAGIDGALGRRTEHAVLCFQVGYRQAAGGPATRLQVRGEWTNNAAADYQNNLNRYNGAAVANPSNADGTSFRQALATYVGA